MAKQIKYAKEARKALKSGVDQLANALSRRLDQKAGMSLG